ncbi:hypothetical protein IHQ68_01345 [Chelatococcus sambhunathii]|uniref:Uncharacterized protein n=1 Tax=Chelatococcus sambhunathii TaxID=363953 RepID=A0ABU1DB46_9HYPH|nr:hypothetical protein [Chelatococcus sambhunathii]MDR4305269.1 hypothetical protein [Chelatococcus sambhunathii]
MHIRLVLPTLTVVASSATEALSLLSSMDDTVGLKIAYEPSGAVLSREELESLARTERPSGVAGPLGQIGRLVPTRRDAA